MRRAVVDGLGDVGPGANGVHDPQICSGKVREQVARRIGGLEVLGIVQEVVAYQISDVWDSPALEVFDKKLIPEKLDVVNERYRPARSLCAGGLGEGILPVRRAHGDR